MDPRPVGNWLLMFSFLGLIVVSVFVATMSTTTGGAAWRKPFVGAIFSFICFLGIVAGLFPSRCSSMFHFRKSRQKAMSLDLAEKGIVASAFRGHHPDCVEFRAHVFQVGSKILCAGCIGLILGALLSIVAVIAYFFLNQALGSDSLSIFWVGFLGVSCGLLQYHVFNLHRSSIHLFVNVFFVFGVSLLLVGIDAIAQSTIADLYVICLSLFWLYTRILLSQIDHQKICFHCKIEECGFH
ncbi:MAG: hypothetical protein NWE78_07870 [Candidatus Bathyarchaeota archaeon]|nr:hypothetical protein [Candidatus Bathyarchaeota archaeon]